MKPIGAGHGEGCDLAVSAVLRNKILPWIVS
jgi:hypothetical protein